VEGEIELAPGEICLTPGPMAQSHKQVVLEGTNELVQWRESRRCMIHFPFFDVCRYTLLYGCQLGKRPSLQRATRRRKRACSTFDAP